jgi:SAM-dependent methyltransferase
VSIATRMQDRARATTKRLTQQAGERFEWGFQRALMTRAERVELNPYQEAFTRWNAQRLGITLDESRARLVASIRTLRGGHSGLAFRIFNDLSHAIYQPFVTDTEREVYAAYEFHSSAHFLRTLSQGPPNWPADHPVLRTFGGAPAVSILDFGCGMAQPSISLAQRLMALGTRPRLLLADIPTLRFEFVGWLAADWGIEARQYPCTPERPVPEIEKCDVLIAREFFEHVYDPVGYFQALDRFLLPGGMLVTNVADHHDEFMHVSPDLAPLRDSLVNLGYDTVLANRVFRKR